MSEDEFERLKALSEDSLASMKQSNFSSKSFILNFLITPGLVILMSYVWYRIGLSLRKDSPLVMYGSFAISLILLVFCGYFYQPIVHVASLAFGIFAKN